MISVHTFNLLNWLHLFVLLKFKARGFNITYGEENADLIVTDLTMEALKRVKGLCLTFKNTGKIRYVNAVDLSGVGVNYVVGLLNPNKDDFPQFTVQKVTPEIVRAGLNSLVEVTLLNVELSGLTSKEAIYRTVTDHFRTKMGFEIIDGTMSYDDKVNKLTFSLPSLFAGEYCLSSVFSLKHLDCFLTFPPLFSL